MTYDQEAALEADEAQAWAYLPLWPLGELGQDSKLSNCTLIAILALVSFRS
jgi:hypothetical protein